jgi:hypothetical protein
MKNRQNKNNYDLNNIDVELKDCFIIISIFHWNSGLFILISDNGETNQNNTPRNPADTHCPPPLDSPQTKVEVSFADLTKDTQHPPSEMRF